jgi:hypothetical protein
MKKVASIVFLLSVMGLISLANKPSSNLPKDYKGKPFVDSIYIAGAQVIPGRVECKYFDFGGEGVGYHDTDSINRGSGEYNYKPGHCNGVTDYVCHFRMNEGVDLSYTKEFLDFNHPNPFTPQRKQGYIGWTNDGEWCNYTVNVFKAGTYKVGLLYSNAAKSFKLCVNGKPAGEFKLTLKTTSYHTWNYAANLGEITFKKAGLNLITLPYCGEMNFAYLDFTN